MKMEESRSVEVGPGWIFPVAECLGCERLQYDGCSMYRGKEDRQHTRIGGCAGRPNKKVVKEEKFVDPLKASKKRAKGKRR